ncbi:DsbC family protein [uncultured Thiodictyon sp.]|uniref:DsbC family protein n=1 Tax=uncultured Thiodictyon sp. TaxID=1846217 RepID=UPI0025E56174|nr:DsbC family protein [uncultured Thiodictyon sp.]
MRFSRFSGLLAAALAAQPHLLWAEPAATLGTILGSSDIAIRRMARLPVGGLQAVETNDGQLIFISDTGRYVVRGKAYDLWHGVALTSLAQAEDLAGRIDLRHLKLDVADLGALDLGTGPDVVAFVDPQCPHCAAFFKDLASLADRYRFRLIPLPIAEDSQSEVLALHCLANTDRAAALAALLEHRADVPVATGTCGQQTAQRTLITAQMFGVRGTPFVIAPDGRIHQGRPDDLIGWLAGTPTGAPKTGEGGQ